MQWKMLNVKTATKQRLWPGNSSTTMNLKIVLNQEFLFEPQNLPT